MRNGLYVQQPITSTQYNPTQASDVVLSSVISGLMVILLPVVVLYAIVGYQTYRARVRQQQIKRLNRLWQLDPSKKIS